MIDGLCKTCVGIAGPHGRGMIDMDDAEAMTYDISYGLAKKAYKFE